MIQVTGFCFEQTSSAVMVDEPLGKLVQQGVQGAVRSNHNDCTSSQTGLAPVTSGLALALATGFIAQNARCTYILTLTVI
jgi:hypothetical protein